MATHSDVTLPRVNTGTTRQAHKSIAAISDSTLFMACYHADLAVTRDGHFITAGGPYPFQFARKIFKFFGLLDNEPFMEWYQQFQPRATASLLSKDGLPAGSAIPITPIMRRLTAAANFPTNRSAETHP